MDATRAGMRPLTAADVRSPGADRAPLRRVAKKGWLGWATVHSNPEASTAATTPSRHGPGSAGHGAWNAGLIGRWLRQAARKTG